MTAVVDYCIQFEGKSLKVFSPTFESGLKSISLSCPDKITTIS